MNRTRFLILALFLQFSIFSSISAQAVPVAVTDANSGQLMGINGIDLLGGIWNVRFVDDTFVNIFDNASGLDFTSEVNANEASTRLLNIYNSIGFEMFTTSPLLTHGIDNPFSGNIITPYSVGPSRYVGVYYSNQDTVGGDLVDVNFEPIITDLSLESTFVFADWTNVSNVPVPAAIWFMGSGLLGLVGFSRKRSQMTA